MCQNCFILNALLILNKLVTNIVCKCVDVFSTAHISRRKLISRVTYVIHNFAVRRSLDISVLIFKYLCILMNSFIYMIEKL